VRGPPLSRPRVGRTAPASRPATFRDVFAVAEFRPLFGSYLLSTIGDELARVALTVLVFQRTQSALLSAITFAVSYLPWLLGGPVLAALADRYPRYRVLIASDVLRAVLVAVMAVPGVPLPVLLLLLLAVSVCAPPFEAARSALMADVLEGDRYAVATSLTGVTAQVGQLIGYLLGGVLLVSFSPSAALLLDAATFALSAVWLSRGLQRRPAPVQDSGSPGVRSLWRDAGSGLTFLAGSPRLRAIVGLLWVAALFGTAPEGIAAPLAIQLDGTTSSTGLLLAASPAGTVVGGLVVGRLCPPALRERLLTPLALTWMVSVLLAGLVPRWLSPGTTALVVVLVLFFVAGIGAAFTIPLNVTFVQAVPSAYRGRAFGVAVAGLSGVQGLGILLAGAGADRLLPSTVVALAGGLGLLAVVVPLLALRRSPAPAAGGDVAHVASPSGTEGRSVA
jgi:MFS family permease